MNHSLSVPNLVVGLGPLYEEFGAHYLGSVTTARFEQTHVRVELLHMVGVLVVVMVANGYACVGGYVDKKIALSFM